jgi:hypothetical protein
VPPIMAHAVRTDARQVVVADTQHSSTVAETKVPYRRFVTSVAVLRWPRDAAERTALAAEGRARLLVVEAGSEPPRRGDPLEDWVRAGSDPMELFARRDVLERRQAIRTPAFIDDDGLLRRGAAWVALTGRETALVRVLLDHAGELVLRRQLLAAIGAPEAPPESRILDRAVHRLRRRLQPVALVILTVRGAGFVLESTGLF